MHSTDLALHTADARAELTGGSFAITDAESIPASPGIYAIWGSESAWNGLRLTFRKATPLYIGKAKRNLRRREIDTHFDAGSGTASKTGSSTVRRSFAALLATTLDLKAIPRNTQRPSDFAHYALNSDDDDTLTAWMHENLSLSVWPYPPAASAQLQDVETALIQAWDPPINIDQAPTSRAGLRAARALLAAEAERWRPAAQRSTRR